ncbi:MAG TPA: ATP-binding protein [Anaerolineales bacterium]|nr:ATP-binding protein [Anaerolineales bacterium]HNB36075.1 ATP-binding protein [Anaerolineales bacterium]HNC08681.1 ATP-binding protein [Anaerolineales bacterium]
MKLTTKLILAFLLISIVSTGIIVVFTRVLASREFDRFINDRYQAELVESLSGYYERNQTWEGVEIEYKPYSHENPGESRPLYFSIANEKGVIQVAGNEYRVGELCDEEEFEEGIPIEVQGNTVGILLMPVSPNHSPLDYEFLRRLNGSIFFSGIATIFLALFLGILLSRSISRPIRELTKATHNMADGNLGQQVIVRSRDEIGELAQSFNKMSADLARSFNLRKQMTADIAHELRTPLSLILGHAEGVHDGVLQPSRENFEIIREEAERLEHLVSDLRTLSLADAGELSVEFQPVNLNELMSDVHTHYLTLFNQKRITLDLETAPGILTANLDPSRFAQVLNNILDNALRYTPEGGRVELKTQLTENRIQLSVKDSGEGVSSEEAQHLFDRFYRVSESRNRNDGGSGLGLAIAKSIVEMHKGRIWAESEKGKGLRVVIELPVG